MSVADDVIGNIVDFKSILVIWKLRFLNEFMTIVKYLDLPVYYSISLYMSAKFEGWLLRKVSEIQASVMR